MPLYVGDTGDGAWSRADRRRIAVTSIIHFAASIVVPDSVRDPLGYYRNNTANSRTLIEAAVKAASSISSSRRPPRSTAIRTSMPVAEDAPTDPMSPYGSSKLMTEIMLRDVGAAHGLRYVILRYFNVAGADPQLRTGQIDAGATHLIKVAVETALGLRAEARRVRHRLSDAGRHLHPRLHPCHRSRARAFDGARASARRRRSVTFNCGYGHGYSVLEVIETVKRVSGRDFAVEHRRPPARRSGRDRGRLRRSIRSALGWAPRFDDLDTIVAHALAWERNWRQKRDEQARRACLTPEFQRLLGLELSGPDGHGKGS